ncbi:transcription elongation factor GreA [Spiroplasma endosymbiont of Amphibalanus improvisus]|uniref:transcription elongation factor GreA n=1 Tax=Spiroplasma endosymbiont of Amphibalanus improvisus TaxID=3066327 RepID=UPI00313C3B1C
MKNNDEILLSKDGLKKLEKELNHLIQVERPKVIEELKEARAQGDLSENADYDAARNRQAEVEGKIKEIESFFKKAKVIKDSKVKKDEVKLGSLVEFKNLKNNNIYTFKILGAIEADTFENSISNESPVAKAMLGHKTGDVVIVGEIESSYKIEILSIK